MNQAETILYFLGFLADVSAQFRGIHLLAQKKTGLRDVTTLVIPFKTTPSNYAHDGVTVSIALNAGIIEPQDPERKAIGISLLIRYSEGAWVAEMEIGWTGKEVGWDNFDSREPRVSTLEELGKDSAAHRMGGRGLHENAG